MNFGILHVSRPEVALAEAGRVLAAGARFAFTTPRPSCEPSRLIGWKRSERRWPPACVGTQTATSSRYRSPRA
jgi:ubiquinone/menaquinone biosynthesis C-methylase UbiE